MAELLTRLYGTTHPCIYTPVLQIGDGRSGLKEANLPPLDQFSWLALLFIIIIKYCDNRVKMKLKLYNIFFTLYNLLCLLFNLHAQFPGRSEDHCFGPAPFPLGGCGLVEYTNDEGKEK